MTPRLITPADAVESLRRKVHQKRAVLTPATLRAA
jgi:hypothetical protein